MKISIITPVYNQYATIQRALDTLFTQTYKDFEHIVIDGVSTDGTLEKDKKTIKMKICW